MRAKALQYEHSLPTRQAKAALNWGDWGLAPENGVGVVVWSSGPSYNIDASNKEDKAKSLQHTNACCAGGRRWHLVSCASRVWTLPNFTCRAQRNASLLRPRQSSESEKRSWARIYTRGVA